MRLLLDDKVSRDYKLNANEACVYACILKCTRAGRGWYGNYRDLAAALPFVINHSTVYRAIKKLLTLGLIERRDEKLFAVLQNETEPLHNETSLLQNETSLLQNALPPTPPIIYNKMNEKERDSRAVRTRDEQTLPTFLDIKQEFINTGGTLTPFDELEAQKVWNSASKPKKMALFKKMRAGRCDKARLTWFITDFPEPQPHDYNGTPEVDYVRDHAKIACYRGHWGFYTLEDIELFNLQTKD